MYVRDEVELAGSPLEVWLRITADDGAALRTLGTRLVRDGTLRNLLRFAHPYDDLGRRIGFDVGVRPWEGRRGSVFVHWDAHFSRLDGELEVLPEGAARTRLRLGASYEPSWAATLADRRALERVAGEAVLEFLLEVAAPAAPTTVPRRRILVEDEDPAWYHLMVRLADADGYEFTSCRGPALVEGGCPVLRGEACPKVEWADTILHSLDQRQPANAALLRSLERRSSELDATRLDGKPPTYCFTRRLS
jgi:hypothetical protein